MACLPQDVGRFATGSTVSHGDSVYLKAVGYVLKPRFGSLLVATRCKRIHNIMIKQVALCVEAHHFATCTNTRVYSHHAFLAQRGGKKQLTEVKREHADGLFISLFLAGSSKFVFHRRLYQAFISIGHSFFNQLRTCTTSPNIVSLQAFGDFFVVDRDAHTKKALALTTSHSQQTIAIAATKWFRKVEIIGVFLCPLLVFLRCNHLRRDDGFTLKGVAYLLSSLLVLANCLGNDVLCALNGSLNIFYITLNVGPRHVLWVGFAL